MADPRYHGQRVPPSTPGPVQSEPPVTRRHGQRVPPDTPGPVQVPMGDGAGPSAPRVPGPSGALHGPATQYPFV